METTKVAANQLIKGDILGDFPVVYDNFSAVYKRLMYLCSKDDLNENESKESADEVQDILTTHKNPKLLVRIINMSHGDMEETMLMWAVWCMKSSIVDMLLRYGANPHYINSLGEGTSTYWYMGIGTWTCTEERQRKAVPIMRSLHEMGVNLARNSDLSYGLVKRSREYDLKIIQEELKNLGYDLEN